MGASFVVIVADIVGLDTVRVQDSRAAKMADDRMLEWAAAEDRVVLRRDHRTLPDFAYARVAKGLAMPGIVVIPRSLALAAAIRDLIALCRADPVVFADLVLWLPLGRQG